MSRRIMAMTAMQTRMFLVSEANIYRLPFLLLLPRTLALPDAHRAFNRFVETTAAARSTFSYTMDGFFHEIETTGDALYRVGTVEHVDGNPGAILASDLIRTTPERPLRAVFIHEGDSVYLGLEMHHLTADGPTLRLLSQFFSGHELPGNSPDDLADANAQIRQWEESYHTCQAGADPFVLTGVETGKAGPVARSSSPINEAAWSRCVSVARGLKVTPWALVRSVVEHCLRQHGQGVAYASVQSWRWRLNRPSLVGGLPALVEGRLGEGLVPERAQELFHAEDPRIAASDCLLTKPTVMVSLETFSIPGCRYVEADTISKCDAHVRVVIDDCGPRVIVEYTLTEKATVVINALSGAIAEGLHNLTSERS